MISARRRSDTRRLLLIGLFVSLIIHLFGGSLLDALSRWLARVMPPPHLASLQEPQARTDIIRLERAIPTPLPQVPAPAHPHHAAPPPPAVREAPEPAPAIVHHEIEHIVIHAPHRDLPVRGPSTATVPREVSPGAPKAKTHPYYSDDQLAQMNASFSKTIADSQITIAAANAAAARPVVTVKHYEMHFAGIHEGMNPGDGNIWPIKHWFANGENWYYVHYQYMYGDGRVEEDDVPWPVHYPPRDDPFARGDRRVPIQGPPPGYQPTRELKPILEAFFGGPNPQEQKTDQ
jgi:hypothetical protein